jgi:type II secretory pathway predicted ATPase ExeA
LNDNVGFIVLTGEIGSGKTTLIRYLLSRIDRDVIPAVVYNTNMKSDQLLCHILQLFELVPDYGNKPQNLETLNKFLFQKYEEGRCVLLIIDEAQNLSDESLEEIRMLSNLQSDDRLLMQIILVGQPELKARFKNPALRQFGQRIAVNYHLQALSLDETKIYIVFRLKKAGGRPDIFNLIAMQMIYQASGGIPRTINLLCDSALVYGFADEVRKIDPRIIKIVIDELGFIGLYDKSASEKNMNRPAPDTNDGNELAQRLVMMESRLQSIQRQLNAQNREMKRQFDSYKKRLVGKANRLIKMERNRSIKLWEDNKRLRMKLKGLGSKTRAG